MQHDLLARPPRYDIVVGLDPREDADPVLHHAFAQAIAHDGVTIHVLTIVPDQRSVWQRARRMTLAPEAEHARDQLLETIEQCLALAVPDEVRAAWSLRLHVARGRLEDEIVAYAADLGAAIIVIGAASPERKTSVDQIIAHADCPVLAVARPRDVVTVEPQCVDCVDVRHSSKGERWFCSQHRARRPGRTIHPVHA